jgi:hypothetical protein
LKGFVKLAEVPFVWDKHLHPNVCQIDYNGVWHIGVGTDLDEFLFYVNLTDADREFLKALGVGVYDGVRDREA